jgi:hypothetical protein
MDSSLKAIRWMFVAQIIIMLETFYFVFVCLRR